MASLQLKTIFCDVIIEGDFSSIAEAVKAAIAGKKSLRYANLSYANLSSANLSYANLSSADLRSADLSYADLSSADLRSADLRSADLSYANLSYANLSYANLSSANLSYANLRSANLRYANLRYANLSSANLSSANLSSADLRSADLRSADLSSADLRSADLRSADLSYVFKALPDLKNPDALILAAIENGGKLEMGDWHKCETTHCRAGWYVQLSGPAGAMLEAIQGPAAAGAIIFAKAYPGKPVPNFTASNAEALADIRANALEGAKV